MMRSRLLTLVLLTSPALAAAQGLEAGGGKVDQGTDNLQTVNQPAGDRSVVRQTAGPGSNGNVQSVTIASPGEPVNRATQETQGAGNTQSIVLSGGSGNVVDQRTGPGSAGSVQSAIVTGSGNTVVQTQGGRENHQSVVQTGGGNVAIQTQRGNGLSSVLQQHGGQTDEQVEDSGPTK
jgi:hypothetical protein